VPAAEALMGLLFANLFWVGLWDLLDTTIFPFDSSYAMLLLVRRANGSSAVDAHARGARQRTRRAFHPSLRPALTPCRRARPPCAPRALAPWRRL
jgi:hypothetical protein